MAVGLSRNELIEFKNITGTDVESFIEDSISFFTGPYNRIVNYYSGKNSGVSKSDFLVLDLLQQELDGIFSTFYLQKNRLNNLKWFLLLEQIEQIDSRFKSLRKIYKWSKSSLTFFGYDPTIEADYTLKDKQTLERVSQDVLNDTTPQDDWYNIAIDNQLVEEDYTPDGGTTIHLRFPRINKGINIDSVVAVMSGKSIYGIDCDMKIQFDPTTEDLKVLSYDDTIRQAVYILANLRKNNNPDFPTQGLQSSIVVGANRASLNYPVITRQLTETFATDDSLKNFQLQELSIDSDVLTISFQVQTRLNETIDGTISI